MNKRTTILAAIYLDDQYYAVTNTEKLQVLDKQLNFIKNIDTKSKYSSITYDYQTHFFYLSKKGIRNQIYKSKNLKNITSIDLPINHLSEIINISYCSYKKSILITTSKIIYMLNLSNHQIKVICEFEIEKAQNGCDCTRPLSCNYKTVFIDAFCCCKEIYVIYNVCGISYISKLNNGQLNEIIYTTNNFIQTSILINNELWLLINKNGIQKLIKLDIDCEYDDRNCECQIIESIALIEKNIAKILDKEAMKIKVAIEKIDDVGDLIKVNDSVNELIYNVTILEFILTEKLKSVKKV